MKEKKVINKKKKLLLWVGISAVLVLGIIISSAFLVPMLSARSELKKQISVFEDFDDGDIVQVFCPMYRDGDFYGDITAEVSFEDSEELVASVLSFSENARYSSTANSVYGNWDICVVLYKADGRTRRIYFTEDELYVTKDTDQYKFEVDEKKSEDYAAFLADLKARIEEARVAES